MPISQAIAGALGRWNLTLLFAIPGALVLLVTAFMALHPDFKAASDSLATAPAESPNYQQAS